MKIQVGDKRLFFDVEGPEYTLKDNKLRHLPTLILLHGAPGNSDHSVFKPALRHVCRIIYLDICGAGRSDDPPTDVFSLERWAYDLVEFCQLLDIHKPIVLGVSGGGFIAMVYGSRHPNHPEIQSSFARNWPWPSTRWRVPGIPWTFGTISIGSLPPP